MQLQTWLFRMTTSPAEFARLIGVDRATVSRWLSGERTPRSVHLRKVESATDGSVTPADWRKVNGK